jgi:PleD family two-component response regulator
MQAVIFLAVSEDADHAPSAWLEYADVALYRAKAEGRNHIQRADQPTRKSSRPNVLRVE